MHDQNPRDQNRHGNGPEHSNVSERGNGRPGEHEHAPSDASPSGDAPSDNASRGDARSETDPDRRAARRLLAAEGQIAYRGDVAADLARLRADDLDRP
jgi:hypothetical protein